MGMPSKKHSFLIANINFGEEAGENKPKPISSKVSIKPKNASRLFLKGPIPFDWLQKANSLGGSTGIVATGLWFYVGLSRSKSFKIDSKLDGLTGVSRQTRQSALQKLEAAGLIKHSNHHGRYPLVEVLTSG